MLAGVASGLGAYFEIDPVWVRLAFFVLTLFGGIGVILYLAGWVLMPAVDFAPPMGTMQPPVRRLYRLRNDRVIAGVASGLGAHLDMDPIWIRLAFVVLAFVGGLGVILYFVGCVAMPLVDNIPPGGAPPGWIPPRGTVPSHRGRGGGTDLRIIAGAVFLIAAVFVLAGTFDFHDAGLIWGAALIGIGLLFLIGDQWPSRYPGGAPSAPSGPVDPAGYAAYAAPGYGAPAAWSGSAYRPGGLRLGSVGLAVVILAVGVALLLQSVGVIHLTAEMGFGIVLLVLGLTLVVGARFGRSGGLVALGICLLPFAAAAVLVPEPLTGGVGQIRFAPQTLTAVQPAYHLAAGQITVDLTTLELGNQNLRVAASDAVGQLVVVVPLGTTVDVTAKVGAGEVNLLGRTDSGVQFTSVANSVAGAEPSGTLTLALSVGCGQITVETGAQ
jgi:phage shock protein PspC (stress-responsive transcriptional regulator)/predicted membrane protein